MPTSQPSPAKKAVKDSPKAMPNRHPKVITRSQVFYLADDQISGLKKLSQETDRSKSDLVREAIASYLEKYGV